MQEEIGLSRICASKKIQLIGGYAPTFRIRQITDTHQDAEGFRDSLFKEFVRQQQKDKNSIWIHTGDLMDSDRPSTRHMKKIMFADRHEAWSMEDKKTFGFLDKHIIPQYEKIADSCAGMIGGDHDYVFSNSLSASEYIANKLKIPYLGERSGFVSLILQINNHDDRVIRYIVHARHGRGGGGTHGGDVAGLVKQESNYLADLHLGGHTHKSNIHSERLEYISRHGRIRNKIVTYMRGGSFLDGFPSSGKKTYAYRKEYSPLPCGWGEVELSLGMSHRDKNNRMMEIRRIKASIISA